MIVNPTAEQPQFADEIRKYTDASTDYASALTLAGNAITSMIAGTTAATAAAPPGWRHRLVRWIMDTFIVSRGLAEEAVGVVFIPAEALIFADGDAFQFADGDYFETAD